MTKPQNDDVRARKRERDRIRQAAKRRAARALPREVYEARSIERMRPWEMFGVSRGTYYRRSKKAMAQSAGAPQ